MHWKHASLGWIALGAIAFGIGAATSARAGVPWGSWRYADGNIKFYNGGTGHYYSYYQQEAISEANSWHNATDVSFQQVAQAGNTDHLNCYNGYYGTTGWLGIAEIRRYSGSIIFEGRARLNQTYLNNQAQYGFHERKHVACHEVGHLLGLNHNGFADSCLGPVFPIAQPGSCDIGYVNATY